MMDRHSRSIRRNALEKLAALSTSSPSFDNSDLDRLCRTSTRPSTSDGLQRQFSGSLARQPMNVREFEVLLALCKAAPRLETYDSAAKLAYQLAPYVLEAHKQVFVPSPFFRDIEPSPIEALSYHLTSALLSIGSKHDTLQEGISRKLWAYLDGCAQAARSIVSGQDTGSTTSHSDVEDAINIAQLTISILGFVDAAATFADFWTSSERLILIERIKSIFSESFLVSVETAFSTIRNSHSQDKSVREWKRYYRHYAGVGRPLGAMILQRSFMWLLLASSSLLVTDIEYIRNGDILDLLLSGDTLPRPSTARSIDNNLAMVEAMAEIASDEMSLLEDGADYLRLGSAWQQRLAFSVKASALTSYLNCAFLNADAADPDTLLNWLETTLADSVQMADETLASVVLRCMALVAKISPALAPNMTRLLPRFIVQGGPREKIATVAANSLAYVLKMLSPDALISTLYTLGNVLSSGSATESNFNTTANGNTLSANGIAGYGSRLPNGSAISLAVAGEEEASTVYANVIHAVCVVAKSFHDEKITALAQSMLLQKISKVNKGVDYRIITEAAVLAMAGSPMEFRSLLKLYDRLTEIGVAANDEYMLQAALQARNYLSSNIKRDSALYDVYLDYLLGSIISKGDVHQTQNKRESDVETAALQIAQLLQPLAILMSTHNLAEDKAAEDDVHSLIRDAWFNIVVHGFTTTSDRGIRYLDELRIIAIHSKPLVADQRGEQQESDIELNTVLRRGMNGEHEALQKKRLSSLMPSKQAEIKSLSYRKVIFLQAAYLVETLRADSGDCTKALTYFLEASMRQGDMSSAMEAVTNAVLDTYLRKSLSGTNPTFSAPYVAKQLVSIFCGCCHRIQRVQQAAMACADRLIREVPSALCQKSSLFALLELLSLMWTSCLEAETDEYEWKSSFTSARGKVTIQLSDDFRMRKETLHTLYRRAKLWVMSVIDVAPLDIKGLLQTYLSEFDDEGAYGHVSLGRSFASEMGAIIPSTDQKLGALDRLGDVHINSASDFIAQYTTRQEYRYAEALPDHDAEWLNFMRIPGERRGSVSSGNDEEDASTVLAHLERRTLQHKLIPMGELRDVLRRAAALLCRSKKDECAIVHHLVAIPFALFTKHSIKLGISLWQGVINENPRMGSRILIEVAQQWEQTIQKRLGIFNGKYPHPDPFYVKEEFAPTDRDALARRQQAAHNLLAPHSRLLQFFASHFNATRLGSPDIQRLFIRLLRSTLVGLGDSTGHPLARDIRYQIILFGLKVLRYSTTLGASSKRRLKDKLLTTALQWFAFAPEWSFGSNRLQLKSELRLLSDVEKELGGVNFKTPQASSTMNYMQAKEELLEILLQNEQNRLSVWLSPSGDRDVGLYGSLSTRVPSEASSSIIILSYVNSLTFHKASITRHVNTAWIISPSLAIFLTVRFKSQKLYQDVRSLLMRHPEHAVTEPEALNLLLGDALPNDVHHQLKYLLYWAPVNPITAITYFLPAYGNHAYILQYAMRALEYHAVDVTFFYVPQIVQTLRYDALGYVERYIVETANFSQLFAHQIIWNMNANAYKDEDSQIPDGIKPTIDKVMGRMIASFSATDKTFYEKEFSFFDEVTSISGKLKPFIKRPKPEKKQKIEEELRKIKVEVGVYLPSNPDGVVIGIDRKSGKPLQSHAKAPYMATFRIRKSLKNMEETEEMVEETSKPNGVAPKDDTIEIWQSAIFKVGDDCRQDVLALQMIAAFRGIFNHVGLDVYVFPYRVTATAPGCGVIDVLPNSISRDMLGREAVNGLYEYFVSKYGNEDSIRFQEARKNFVKSMAAYSVISYLLQFKDRHNGNIMLDDAGHILHIDFGFCFDIAPGGVKFERAPFKLTTEMVSVMGGSTEHQSYKWFEELCVKAFLASRNYTEKLSQLVLLMMDSGLPCFKPETIQNFKDRFVLGRTEREAAEYMKALIKKSHGSYSTTVYDEFQRQTNAIPY